MTSEVEALFVTGETLPFDLSDRDVAVSIVPHQESTRAPRRERDGLPPFATQRLGCVLESGGSHQGIGMIDDVASEDGNGVWLDSLNLPTACLVSNVARWLQVTKSIETATLSIVLRPPSAELPIASANVWRPDAARPLLDEEIRSRSFVWYPSLSRTASFLEGCAERLQPVDVFPLVELPTPDQLQSDLYLLAQRDMLQDYRVRTERIIYMPPSRPQVVFANLARSLRALSRSSSAPRQGVVTPGLPSFLYIAEILAAVTAGGCVMVPKEEVVFQRAEVIGYAVLIRRP